MTRHDAYFSISSWTSTVSNEYRIAMKLQPAIPSASLGHPSVHGIIERLTRAAELGFKAIEIVDEDLVPKTTQQFGDHTDAQQLDLAHIVKESCDRLGLLVLAFQPFRFYEGLLDREAHQEKIKKMKLWLKIAKILDTTMIQVPSNWLEQGTTGDMEVIVADFIEMAELGLQQDPVVRFAYEGVAWGKYIDTWQGTWEVVKRVDRHNFGLCLDTFHIVGRVWGDPTAQNGRTPNADEDLQESLLQLVREVDVKKVFYIQVGDAERLAHPLDQDHPFYSEDRPSRMSWSRNARLFAYEEDRGGYLPIELVVRAIVHGLGYSGWISLELFSRELFGSNPEIPLKYAVRAAESWQKMVERLSL
jgi:3-dehydroshikimate dehydratase